LHFCFYNRAEKLCFNLKGSEFTYKVVKTAFEKESLGGFICSITD
jgi:hypothetical protein